MNKNDNPFRNSLVHKYTPLLCKIASNFEFNHEETDDLIGQVDSFVNSHSCVPDHRLFKIWIAKVMVRRCVFKISDPFFSKSDWRSANLDYRSRHDHRLKDMPLTIRTAFVLSSTTDFSESEIAELLNITPIKVKERLNKARLIINR